MCVIGIYNLFLTYVFVYWILKETILHAAGKQGLIRVQYIFCLHLKLKLGYGILNFVLK